MDSTALLQKYMQTGQRVLFVGPPGIGKTARVLAATAACGRRLVTMRASLSERVDFGGCLVPDMDAGLTRALPLDILNDLQTTTVPTVLFLDDLGQAPTDVQSALMRLFDPGVLSPSVLIWGATNRPGDKAGVTALCEPLRSRFHLAFSIPTPESDDAPDGATMLGTWKDEVDGWCNWAFDNDCHPTIVAYHRFTSGTNLYDWKPQADPAMRMPDFRSWATVMRLVQAGLSDMLTVSAAIGKPAAAAFLAFSSLSSKLPSPDQVFMDPNGSPVPDDPSALFLVSSALAAAATIPHVPALFTYIDRLPRVYGAMIARDILRRLDRNALTGSKEWVRWFTANQELFS